MFLSRIFSRMPVLGGMLVGAVLLTTAGRGMAQQINNNVPKFDRANAGAALPGAWYTPWYASKAPAPPSRPTPKVVTRPAVGLLLVTVRTPMQAEPVYVTLRGLDGEIQRYTLESGPESIQTRTVIVRQGETASFRFAVADSQKGASPR